MKTPKSSLTALILHIKKLAEEYPIRVAAEFELNSSGEVSLIFRALYLK